MATKISGSGMQILYCKCLIVQENFVFVKVRKKNSPRTAACKPFMVCIHSFKLLQSYSLFFPLRKSFFVPYYDIDTILNCSELFTLHLYYQDVFLATLVHEV